MSRKSREISTVKETVKMRQLSLMTVEEE